MIQGQGTGRLITGRYELSTLIGQGGMGQVWTAYDQRLDRRVAVKLLRPDKVAGQEADELRRRFVRECRVTAQVDHPGLVTVHDAGSEGEELFLVMQYVDGADLADHLAEHDPYPWQWTVSVAAQLCAVLSAVHAVPIIHRDLKPRNVMVKQDGTVTVLDLGVASVMDTDTTRLTHTGSPIGSPAYMAPEQAMGGAVGPYTDLYALGVLIHELLSGNVPFTGSTALGVLHRHLYEPPVPVRRLRPEVPENLEALVLRLLSKDPQHRPSSAQETYEQLLPLLPARGMPTGSPLDPTRPFLRPHAPWPDRARIPAPQPSAAPDPAPAADKPDVAGAVDEVKRLLGEGRITQAVDILGAILPAAAAQHGEHSPVVRTLRKQYAATLMDDGQYRRALPELRRLADERATEAGQADTQALRFRYDSAQCLEQLGEPAAALAEYRSLLPYYENQYVGGDPELSLDVRRRIGHLLLALGDRGAAHETLGRLLLDVERLRGRAIRWRARSGARCSGWGRCAADTGGRSWPWWDKRCDGRCPAPRVGRWWLGPGTTVPEVGVNRWSNGWPRAGPLPTIDHRKTLCTAAQSPREAHLHRRRRTALLLSAAITAAAPLLTACGSDAHPGAAAVVGADRITVAQLENRVNEVRAAQRAAITDADQYQQVVAQSGALTRNTLNGMVLEKVLDQALDDAGVTVTRKEVQQYRSDLEKEAGGAEALEAAYLQRYSVAPEQLEESLSSDVEVQKLSTALGADLNTQEGGTVFWQALSEASEKLDVDLNPRYGSWGVDPTSGRVGLLDAKTPWLKDVTAAGTPESA